MDQRDSRDFAARASLASHSLAPLSGSDAVLETAFLCIMCKYIPALKRRSTVYPNHRTPSKPTLQTPNPSAPMLNASLFQVGGPRLIQLHCRLAMGRYPQQPGSKGSQHWLQWLVNDSPELFDQRIGIGRIDWCSPLRGDDFAEYRDQDFLDLLSIELPARPLASFWPRQGPQWDALGRAPSGEVILVEAKAHVNEIYSPPMAASAETSREQIKASLSETAQGLGVPRGYDWWKHFYQYANRLAHAYLLDRLNGIPTRLVFLYLVGDADVGGPTSCAEWQTEIHKVHAKLGLATLPAFVSDVFIDVRKFGSAVR
ncbi:MAG: hypothetical protein OXL36_15475 [Bryobacterales bacterium]|nr:hypothetical protein [Bryobacterales bacterium]